MRGAVTRLRQGWHATIEALGNQVAMWEGQEHMTIDSGAVLIENEYPDYADVVLGLGDDGETCHDPEAG